MGLFYKADRMRTVIKIPATTESDFELVSDLKKAGEDEAAIAEVLGKHSSLTASQIRDSLVEVAATPETAMIAMKAAILAGKKNVVRYAAGVIESTSFLSDSVKTLARQLLGERQSVQVTMMGRGRGERGIGTPGPGRIRR